MALRLHPLTLQQVEDFSFTYDLVYVEKETDQYEDGIRKTSLIITDYSSIAFDYAYRRGYINSLHDGFSEVVKDYESTVEAILKMMENDCKMEDKHRGRVDSFMLSMTIIAENVSIMKY